MSVQLECILCGRQWWVDRLVSAADCPSCSRPRDMTPPPSREPLMVQIEAIIRSKRQLP